MTLVKTMDDDGSFSVESKPHRQPEDIDMVMAIYNRMVNKEKEGKARLGLLEALATWRLKEIQRIRKEQREIEEWKENRIELTEGDEREGRPRSGPRMEAVGMMSLEYEDQ